MHRIGGVLTQLWVIFSNPIVHLSLFCLSVRHWRHGLLSANLLTWIEHLVVRVNIYALGHTLQVCVLLSATIIALTHCHIFICIYQCIETSWLGCFSSLLPRITRRSTLLTLLTRVMIASDQTALRNSKLRGQDITLLVLESRIRSIFHVQSLILLMLFGSLKSDTIVLWSFMMDTASMLYRLVHQPSFSVI